MTGYLSDIRSFFDKKYDGRYFSILLRELARHEPQSFALIINFVADQVPKKGNKNRWRDGWRNFGKDIRAGNFDVDIESRFPGKSGKNRRADVAFRDESGKPLLLIELKDEDHKSSGNEMQLDDYLSYTPQLVGWVPFIHISKHFEPNAFARIKKLQENYGRHVASLRYHDIYAALSTAALNKASAPIANMICNYLEDIGVGGYREINVKKDNKHYAFLLSQMLGFPNRHGLKVKHSRDSVNDIPETFKKLYGNLDVIGDWVLEANPAVKQSFIRKFSISPNLNTKKVLKEARNITKIEIEPFEVHRLVESGEVFFFATGPIPHSAKSKGWLNIEFGFNFVVEVGTPEVSLYVYSAFYADSHKYAVGYEFQLCNRYDAASVGKLFRSVLIKSKTVAEKELSGWHKTAVKQFKIPHAA